MAPVGFWSSPTFPPHSDVRCVWVRTNSRAEEGARKPKSGAYLSARSENRHPNPRDRERAARSSLKSLFLTLYGPPARAATLLKCGLGIADHRAALRVVQRRHPRLDQRRSIASSIRRRWAERHGRVDTMGRHRSGTAVGTASSRRSGFRPEPWRQRRARSGRSVVAVVLHPRYHWLI